MATPKKAEHTPDSKADQPSPHTYILTLATRKGRRRIRVTAKAYPTHLRSVKLQNARKPRFRSILRGAGSIVALMPSPPPRLQRNAVGSFAETHRRIARTWNRAFQTVKE